MLCYCFYCKKNLISWRYKRSYSKLILMGYLPIAVALLGLIVLYSLYTYNRIKPLKAALTRVIDDMAVVSRTRKNTILEYDRQNEGSPLAKAAGELKKTSTDRFQSYKKESNLISVTNQAVAELGNTELKQEINGLNEKQEALIKRLESTSATYNKFIKKAPASTIASLFGFRPF